MLQQDREVTAALAKGGMWNEAGVDGAEDTHGLGKYNAFLDPAGAEKLGKMLAASVASLVATCILLQEEEPPDLILAYVVARELGLTPARAFDRDGLMGIVGRLGPDDRVLVVADAIRDERIVDALRAAVDRAGSSIVGFAVLVQTHALEAKARPEQPVYFLARERVPADG